MFLIFLSYITKVGYELGVNSFTNVETYFCFTVLEESSGDECYSEQSGDWGDRTLIEAILKILRPEIYLLFNHAFLYTTISVHFWGCTQSQRSKQTQQAAIMLTWTCSYISGTKDFLRTHLRLEPQKTNPAPPLSTPLIPMHGEAIVHAISV